ncbi:MAG TPA: hypothetical protein VMV69_16050 [Pirellulales bacterium]|nr:hypothetical protein [Pirellulales bacterium]
MDHNLQNTVSQFLVSTRPETAPRRLGGATVYVPPSRAGSSAPRRYAKKNDSETHPKRSKRAWGKAKGAKATVARFRGLLRVLGLSEIVFFSLRCRFFSHARCCATRVHFA